MYYIIAGLFLFALLVVNADSNKLYTLKLAGKITIKTNLDTIFFHCMLLFMLFMLCFKSMKIGADTFTYEYMYTQAKYYISTDVVGMLLDWKRQPLYYIFFFVFEGLGVPFRGMQIFIYVFSMFVLRKYIMNTTRNKFLALYLFFSLGLLFFYMSGLRQVLAISFGLLSAMKITEKKLMQSILYTVVAVLFHKTAIVLLVPIIVVAFNLSVRQIYKYAVIAWFVCFIIPSNLFLFASNKLGYIGYESIIGRPSNILMVFMFLLIGLFCAFMCLSRKPSVQEKDGVTITLFVICILIYILSAKFYLFSRVAYYFMPALCVTTADSCEELMKRKKGIIYAGIMLLFFVYLIFAIRDDSVGVNPFVFFWQTGESW